MLRVAMVGVMGRPQDSAGLIDWGPPSWDIVLYFVTGICRQSDYEANALYFKLDIKKSKAAGLHVLL